MIDRTKEQHLWNYQNLPTLCAQVQEELRREGIKSCPVCRGEVEVRYRWLDSRFGRRNLQLYLRCMNEGGPQHNEDVLFAYDVRKTECPSEVALAIYALRERWAQQRYQKMIATVNEVAAYTQRQEAELPRYVAKSASQILPSKGEIAAEMGLSRDAPEEVVLGELRKRAEDLQAERDKLQKEITELRQRLASETQRASKAADNSTVWMEKLNETYRNLEEWELRARRAEAKLRGK